MADGRFLGGAAVLLGLALVLAGCDEGSEEDEISFDVPVVVETAARGGIESTLTTTGTVRAVRETRLLTPTGGKLTVLQNRETGRPYQDGDLMRRGTVIALVEGEEQEVNKRSGLEAKRRRLEVAEAELERKRRLNAEGIVTEVDVKAAISDAASARYDYEQGLIVRAQTKVESPMVGVLTAVTEAGNDERVAAGYEVARVVDFSEVIVEGRLSASDLAMVEKGQKARIISYSYQDRSFEGTVSNISPTVDPETRTFEVEIRLPNPEGLLRPGLFVKVDLVVEERQDVLVVPKDAVVLRKNRPVLFLVKRQIARESEVELGLDGGEKVEVVKGLEEGDRYVTVGQQTLSDGSPVRVR